MRRASSYPFMSLGLVLALVVSLLASSAATAAAPAGGGAYIVVFEDGVDVDAAVPAVARAHGLTVGHVYRHALKGMSVSVPAGRLAALRNNRNVAYVETDDPVQVEAQATPTGVDRTFATGNPDLDIDGEDDFRVDVDVAVIDTGVDFEHPDLNVAGGVDCTLTSGGGPPWARQHYCSSTGGTGGDDDHYHGTHVAGTVGAIDNGIGVVGVAPGARIWAVKVLDSSGRGYESGIVAGIDWIVAQGTIEVANMSLGGSGYSQAEYDAIDGAVGNGVAFAVAAGNDDDDASGYSPAAFDNALTVSALADFDGAPGAAAAPTCRADQDDTLADFSNWGGAVDIAAPGVCILSTYPLEEGGYGTISGTSMASPHAAGALALLASTTPASDAADVADLYATLVDTGSHDWVDDSGDGVLEPLLDVSTLSPSLIPGGGGTGGPFPLAATGYKIRGQKYVDLTWSGASSADIDVFRNGNLHTTTTNDGAETIGSLGNGGGSDAIQVCEAGTVTCSDTATIDW